MQNYVSNNLYHFVGRSIENEDEQYELMVKIIKDGWLTFPPHENINNPGQIAINSFKENKINEMFNPMCVCFADIPLSDLKIHMHKYSKFGIGFSKPFLIERGANPVFYIEENSLMYGVDSTRKVDYYQECCSKTVWYFMHKYMACCSESKTELEHTQQIFSFLVNVFSHFKVWNSSLEDNDPDNYYFEREWRTINNVNFYLSDIQTIIIPKDYERRLREDLPEYSGDIEFSD